MLKSYENASILVFFVAFGEKKHKRVDKWGLTEDYRKIGGKVVWEKSFSFAHHQKWKIARPHSNIYVRSLEPYVEQQMFWCGLGTFILSTWKKNWLHRFLFLAFFR